MRMNASVAACTVAVLLLSGPRLHAEDSLEAARQLYASAEYTSALAMLNALATSESPREERRTIALYRTLCLLAVGRGAEADRAIEAMVSMDPLYRPDADDIPPRMRAAISEARKRMLPAILQERYKESKARLRSPGLRTRRQRLQGDAGRACRFGHRDRGVAVTAGRPEDAGRGLLRAELEGAGACRDSGSGCRGAATGTASDDPGRSSTRPTIATWFRRRPSASRFPRSLAA